MATYICDNPEETEFIGRKEFLRELDDAWSRKIRIFGIFGLRSVGKTRTIFEFIKRKTHRVTTPNRAINHSDEFQERDSGLTKVKETNAPSKEEPVNKQHTGIIQKDEPSAFAEIKPFDDLATELGKASIGSSETKVPVKLIYVDLRKFKEFTTFSSNVCAQLGTESAAKTVLEFLVNLRTVLNESPEQLHVFLFDNSEDAVEGKLDFPLLDISTNLVQKNKHVRVILTATTNARFAQMGKIYQAFELEPMTDVEGSKLLRSLVKHSVEFAETFERIITLCAGLPLAIMMVAAELNAGTSSEKMVQMLGDCRVEALSNEKYPDDKRIDDVYKKFIERLSKVFQDRIAILGYIPGSFNVWEAQQMLGNETPSETKIEAIVPLRARNFLQNAPSYSIQVDQRRFDIHGIIKECLSLYFEIRNLPETRKRYCTTFVTVMKQISQQMGTREYANAVLRFTIEHPNLQQLLTDVFYTTEDTYHFYMEVVVSCSDVIEKFMAAQGEKFYHACHQLASMNGQAKDLVNVKIALGSMQTNSRGQFSTGLKYCQEALDIAKNFPPSQNIAKVYQKLGFNMYLQGNGEDGLRYLQKSLEITSVLGHPNTEEFLNTTATLGIVYSWLGRYEEAEKCHFLVLNRRIALQGKDHPSVGKQLNNLGIMYEQMGNVDKARQYFVEGLAKKKSAKAEPVTIVNSLSNVARLNADLGNFDKAEALLNEAQELLREKNVNNVSAFGLIHNSFGKVLLKKQDFRNAVVHLKESIKIKKTTMQSESNPFFVNPLILMARGYIGRENYGAAINRLNQALSLKDALVEKAPHNDLVYQCYEEMHRVHEILKNQRLISETTTSMGTELFRLIQYFENEGNVTKAEQFRQKLVQLK